MKNFKEAGSEERGRGPHAVESGGTPKNRATSAPLPRSPETRGFCWNGTLKGPRQRVPVRGRGTTVAPVCGAPGVRSDSRSAGRPVVAGPFPAGARGRGGGVPGGGSRAYNLS